MLERLTLAQINARNISENLLNKFSDRKLFVLRKIITKKLYNNKMNSIKI